MSRQGVEYLEIPVEAGVFNAGTDWHTGPRLRSAAHFAVLWPRQPNYNLIGVPQDSTNKQLMSDCASGSIQGIGHLVDVDRLVYHVGGGRSESDSLVEWWNFATGAKLTGPSIATNPGPATFAFFPNISIPTLYMASGQAGQDQSPEFIQKTTNGTSRSNHTIDVIDKDSNGDYVYGMPITAVKNHLDRLFVARQQFGNRTLVYFTDPLATSTVRPGNFLDVPDLTTCLFNPNVSSVDYGARSTLCVGNVNSIHVLDGDPNQGNAVFRRLRQGIGIHGANLVQETSKGAVLFGSNGVTTRLYLIPPNALDLVYIDQTLDVGALGTVKCMYWKDPYLRIGTTQGLFVGDFSEFVNADGRTIKWWGPSQIPLTSGFMSSGYYFFSAGVVQEYGMVEDTLYPILGLPDDPNLENIQFPSLLTGYISKPNHDVIASRVRLVFRKPISGSFKVRHSILGFSGVGSEVKDFTVSSGPGGEEVLTWAPIYRGRGFAFRCLLQMNPEAVNNFRSWGIEYKTIARTQA